MSALGRITGGSHITYNSLVFFIAYAFKGQVHVFAGQVKIVSHSSCRTSAILKYFCPLIHLSLLSTGSTQEDPFHPDITEKLLTLKEWYQTRTKSWHSWKIVDCDVKNQIKANTFACSLSVFSCMFSWLPWLYYVLLVPNSYSHSLE